ncbi:MAG: ZIP family metal transporter [Chloroflexota bacterium]
MNLLLEVLPISIVAGLGTGLGGLIAVFCKPGRRSFGLLMGGAAGVMITLAFMELVSAAWEQAGYLTATLGFAAGALFMLTVDFLAPHIRFGERETDVFMLDNRDRQGDGLRKTIYAQRLLRRQRKQGRNIIRDRNLYRTGMLIAIGIAIHNMPEGIAIGAGYLHAPRFGYFIAVAIALHNIPEGIATALPLYKSGVYRWDAFRAALFSGLTEPIGALLAVTLLATFRDLVPAALAFAGGVMVFITLDELVPAAREHGHQHFTAIGIILGAIFVFLLSGIFGPV